MYLLAAFNGRSLTRKQTANIPLPISMELFMFESNTRSRCHIFRLVHPPSFVCAKVSHVLETPSQDVTSLTGANTFGDSYSYDCTSTKDCNELRSLDATKYVTQHVSAEWFWCFDFTGVVGFTKCGSTYITALHNHSVIHECTTSILSGSSLGGPHNGLVQLKQNPHLSLQRIIIALYISSRDLCSAGW